MPVSAPAPTQPAARLTTPATPAAPTAPAQPGAGFAGEVEQALAQAGAAAPAPEPPGLATPDSPKPSVEPSQPDPATPASLTLPPPPALDGPRSAAPACGTKLVRLAPKPDDEQPGADATTTDPVAMPLPAAPPPAPEIKPPATPASPHARQGTPDAPEEGALQAARKPIAPARDQAAQVHAPAPLASEPKPEIQPTLGVDPSPPEPKPALSPAVPMAAPSGAPTPHQPPPMQDAAPAPPPPSAQIAAALPEPVQVTLASPAQQGGPQTLTIQLKPAELGRVEVRIERAAGGPAKIEVAVERTDTLMLLVRDQSQLHQALDQAGLPQDGRTLHFTLAADASPASAGSGLGAGTGSGAGAGGGHRSGYGQPGHPASSDDPDPPTAYRSWTRSGLDITA